MPKYILHTTFDMVPQMSLKMAGKSIFQSMKWPSNTKLATSYTDAKMSYSTRTYYTSDV